MLQNLSELTVGGPTHLAIDDFALVEMGLDKDAKDALPAPEDRGQAILRKFIGELDWDQVDGDLSLLQELQTILARRNEDETSSALGRVVELLENMVDTAESCGLK